MRIKVTYEGFDEKMENAFKKAIKKFHYNFDSSGYNFETKERDLLFIKRKQK